MYEPSKRARKQTLPIGYTSGVFTVAFVVALLSTFASGQTQPSIYPGYSWKTSDSPENLG